MSQPPPPAPQTSGPVRPPRPFTVTIVIIIITIYSLFTLFGAVMLFIAAFSNDNNVTIVNEQTVTQTSTSTLFIGAGILLVVGFLQLLCAMGLARGSNGWRILLAFLLILNLIGAIGTAVQVGIGPAIIQVIVVLVGLWLLFNHKAANFFRPR